MAPTPRFYVSIDENKQPLAQRNTLRPKPYLSANFSGGSFSSSPPNGAYPRTVIEVVKAIEWVARATLTDGSKVESRSKSGPVGQNYVAYSYLLGKERCDAVAWTNHPTAEEWLRKQHGRSELELQVRAFARGAVEIRNWPPASDAAAELGFGEACPNG